MGVFLIILKIIGIVLALVLALLAVLLILVLFCPITYRICGSYQEKSLNLKARVWWLGCLLGFGADVAEEQNVMFIRIAGIKKRLGQSEDHQSGDNLYDSADTVSDWEPEENEGTKKPALTVLETSGEEESFSTPEEEETESEERETVWEKSKSAFGFLPWKMKNLFQKISTFSKNLQRSAKKFRHEWKKWVSFIQNEQNKTAFGHIWKEVKHLIKIILPGKCKLTLSYSTGSPDTTGQILGILAMFPVGYRNHWKVMPDFTSEEFFIDAEFDARGHLFGIQILTAAFRILLDKNCKKLYNRIKRMK